MEKIKAGAVVQLRSGGPYMVVRDFIDGDDEVLCEYIIGHVSDEDNGLWETAELKVEEFKVTSLRVIEEAE